MEKQNNKMRYDLIVKVDSDCFENLRNSNEFMELADWKKFGTSSFRGFCLLDKEETEKFVIEKLGLKSNEFQVVKANIGLYLPS